jgi:hypothetical protein
VSRPKKRGYKLPPGKFASIPVDHLKQAAGILSACELRVWLALCAQSQPWNNGTAKLCRSVVKEFHLGSWTTVSAATEKMIEAKLIVRTRKFRPRHCALYGVTHMALNRDAMDKASAVEDAEQLAPDSCSKTLATGAVARTTGGSSKSGQDGSDSLQRLYRSKGKTPSNSLHVLYQSKTLPSPLGFSEPSSGSDSPSEIPAPLSVARAS